MICPHCGRKEGVVCIGLPTVKLLIAYASCLGLSILGPAAALALSTTYKVTGKKIYKCTNSTCNKYFIA